MLMYFFLQTTNDHTEECFSFFLSTLPGVIDEQIGVGHFAERSFNKTGRSIKELVKIFRHHDNLETIQQN